MNPIDKFKRKKSAQKPADKIFPTFLIASLNIAGGIILLTIEAPNTPKNLWGWVIPFLLPIPIYFFLSKVEVPKASGYIQAISPIRKFFWDLKLAKALALFYFVCIFLIWLGIKPFLY